jgi:alginate O-acetyltransferase complex protein AlgI
VIPWDDLTTLLFVVAFVAGAWAAPRSLQRPVMAIVSLGYLAVADVRSFGVLVALTLVSYLLIRPPSPSLARLWLVVAAVVGAIFAARLYPRLTHVHRIFLLGLAYYGLRVIHVAADRYAGRLKAPAFVEYVLYLVFLPSLTAGPINRLEEFQRDSQRRRWDAGAFALGLERVLYGAFKCVVLGNWLFDNYLRIRFRGLVVPLSWGATYGNAVLDWGNLYAQFAGYTDIAIGLGLLVGYRLPENFRWPFLAPNINEFWQRWHITLGRFCRDYVFVPASSWLRSPYGAVVLSMLALGLWHDLSPRYFIWGLYHGTGIACWQGFQALKPRLPAVRSPVVHRVLWVGSVLLTVNFVVLSFVVTREVPLALRRLVQKPAVERSHD